VLPWNTSGLYARRW